MTTILVADEEQGVREMLRGELVARGYQVMTARDGHEVMALLDRFEIDVVLSELAGVPTAMPFLHRCKQVAPLTEIVLSTATEHDVGCAVRCVESGAFGYIHKPFGIHDVVATLERALERRQLRAESALHQMSRAILDTHEPQRLADVIVKVAMEALGADASMLMLPGPDERLYVACRAALTDSIGRQVHAALAPLAIARAPRSREPLLDTCAAVPSFIVYPLWIGERLVGALAIARLINPRAFRAIDLDKVSVIASQTLLALENVRLVRGAISAERFATVGQIATSIAHEVNNPLAYVLASHAHLRDQLVHVVELCQQISAGADLAQLRATFERAGGQAFIDELLQASDDVRDGAGRMRDILRDTRALTSSQDLTPSVFDINEAIRSALRIVAAELCHKAEVTTELADGLRVTGVPGQLSQVFVHLLAHAAEAFGDRGGNALTIRSVVSGGNVVVTLSDNGPGTSSEHLPGMFDAVCSGGLGLPISRDIVRQHGGEIAAQSAPGTGTTFRIVLPFATRPPREPTLPPPFVPHADGARRRLLFVDDEANILRAYRRAFGREHDVTLVGSGRDALAACDERPDFDLVVCDLSMPTMSGMQLYQLVGERYPAIADRFVFATGGAVQRELDEFLRSVQNRVLEKPFDMSVLRDLIAELGGVA